MRAVLKGIDTLFLLNAVAPDETTQALGTLGLAREARIQRIVYFSVFNSALFDDVPHFDARLDGARSSLDAAGFSPFRDDSRKGQPHDIRGLDRSSLAELPRFRAGGSRELVNDI